ncbi:Protein SIP5 [Smittium culicis]|uniref:Protein SIP5 n=1 Tax=Smittium culicis TaxID=133412 RepID=A0A1R1YTC4_9FUNG|nr:Protein SIP5 [Smittium culicis]OMJ30142.1 Protein SIP5 [Smittium culicis]
MGNHHSRHIGSYFDGGSLRPYGIYKDGDSDLDFKIIEKLIYERSMAPFYKGADESEEFTSSKDTIISAHKISPQPNQDSQTYSLSNDSSLTSDSQQSKSGLDLSTNKSSIASSNLKAQHTPKKSILSKIKKGLSSPIDNDLSPNRDSISSHSVKFKFPPTDSNGHTRNNSASKISPEINSSAFDELKKKIIECPICFLYYPKNINYSVCCKKPICSECFIQFKRTEQHSSPVECPFCLAENFSISYSPPAIALEKQPFKKHSARVKSVSHIVSPVLKASAIGNHKRSHSLTPQNLARFKINCDDIRPAMMKKIERIKREQLQLINRREQIISSLGQPASNSILVAPRPSTSNALSNSTNPTVQTLRMSERGRTLLNQYRQDGGVSIDDFLLQEAISLSRESFMLHNITGMIETTADANTNNPPQLK